MSVKEPKAQRELTAAQKIIDTRRRAELARLQATRWPERAIAASQQARLERHYPRPEK